MGLRLVRLLFAIKPTDVFAGGKGPVAMNDLRTMLAARFKLITLALFPAVEV